MIYWRVYRILVLGTLWCFFIFRVAVSKHWLLTSSSVYILSYRPGQWGLMAQGLTEKCEFVWKMWFWWIQLITHLFCSHWGQSSRFVILKNSQCTKWQAQKRKAHAFSRLSKASVVSPPKSYIEIFNSDGLMAENIITNQYSRKIITSLRQLLGNRKCFKAWRLKIPVSCKTLKRKQRNQGSRKQMHQVERFTWFPMSWVQQD